MCSSDLRGTEKVRDLCRGPGRLCQALAIGRSLYGADVTKPGPLYIREGRRPEKILSTPRIGIEYAFHTKDEPWRYIVPGSPFVSGPKSRNG